MNLKYVSNIDKSYLYFFHIKNISKYQIRHQKSQKKSQKAGGLTVTAQPILLHNIKGNSGT